MDNDVEESLYETLKRYENALEDILQNRMIKNIKLSEDHGQDMWTTDPKTIAYQALYLKEY